MASRSRQPRGREGKEEKAGKRGRRRKGRGRVERRRKIEGRRAGGRMGKELEGEGAGGVFLLSVQHGGEYISTVFGYI